MHFASLGSGSKGNGTLVKSAGACLLVDCGFGLNDTLARLSSRGLSAEQLDGILVTHEHGDHIRGVAMLARRFNLPVYATFGTVRAVQGGRQSLDEVQLEEVRPGRQLVIGDIRVMPVAVPHDAREPCQYVFECGGRRLGVLTDLGAVTPHVQDCYGDCDALLLETNHDVQMLRHGPYPPSLKRRVGGDLGHLSNVQAAGLVQAIAQQRLQHLVLSHISEQNNTPEHARRELSAVLRDGHDRITIACQNQGFDWLQIN